MYLNPYIYNISSNQSIENVEPTQINLIELLNLDGYKTNGIKCGGDTELNQYREQWTDGANAFALKPGIAIGYNRNIHTIEELKKNKGSTSLGFRQKLSEEAFSQTSYYDSIVTNYLTKKLEKSPFQNLSS